MNAGITTYLAGQALNLVISTQREDGTFPVVASASYQVLDVLNVVRAEGNVSTIPAGATELAVVIPVEANTLAVGERRAFRTVRVSLVTEGSQNEIRLLDYIIEGESLLEIWGNTYQSYGDAVLLAMDIPNLESWNFATKSQRVTALIAAHHAIQELTFRSSVNGLVPYDLTKITLPQFRALDPAFIESIMRAQVIEANELLDDDEITKLRELGVMSKTVGESKMFFRSNRGTQNVVTRRTLKELHRWLDTETRIGRA